jgi:hypothetical protein
MHIPVYTNLTNNNEILSILQTALPEKDFDYVDINQNRWSKTSAKKHFEQIFLIKKPKIKVYELKYFIDNIATKIHLYSDSYVQKHNISGDTINEHIQEYNEIKTEFPESNFPTLTLIDTHY